MFLIYSCLVNYLQGQDAYLLHTGECPALVANSCAHIAISHDYFTVAVATGPSIYYFNTTTHELEESLEDVHNGILIHILFPIYIYILYNCFIFLLFFL